MLRCRPNASPCCSGLRVRRDEVVARRRAHALAEAVGEAAGQRQRPAGGQRDHQLAEGAEGVAGKHEGPAPAGVVGGLPEGVLGDAGRRFGDALDEAEDRHRKAEHRGHEDREQRVRDLRAQVGEEADEAEAAHVGIEAAQARDGVQRAKALHRPMLSVERLQNGEAFGARGPVELGVERREGERLRAGALPRALSAAVSWTASNPRRPRAKREIGRPSFVQLDRDEIARQSRRHVSRWSRSQCFVRDPPASMAPGRVPLLPRVASPCDVAWRSAAAIQLRTAGECSSSTIELQQAAGVQVEDHVRSRISITVFEDRLALRSDRRACRDLRAPARPLDHPAVHESTQSHRAARPAPEMIATSLP